MRLLNRTNERHEDNNPHQRKILVADDDPAILRLVEVALSGQRYQLVTVSNGLEALKMYRDGEYQLLLIDVMMPYIDGFTVTERIRARSDVPIIIITARDGTDDVVHGFELGADDYITKPFRTAELQARVEAIIRRVEGYQHRKASPIVRIGDLEIDEPRHKVLLAGEDVNLTPMEFELLYFLAANSGQVFDREVLFREVWGYEYVGQTNLVDVCVRRLREKIEEQPSKPRRILTVRGVGYKLADGGSL
ncbi:MAG TPA: DNA-binding response regulator [Herpetosiphon sp.]|uniref:Two component transcriptional regulator, winged helix family n=1 Tax=Herpetosiphon aurantiacus (strain ATCC 23779 / DSM 785 / 114-95) TaxID=316274 RepID=A9AVR8_HERA2|nr:response regulator transcription factor [Herpetosiphon sp.]ABX06668.1 two component transcriptional regulator, winged helix family [Herpetosiphon aurantiacus DSM 785]HBW49335.1 DNA-binding response regulator [Herpetosiphon sp.]